MVASALVLQHASQGTNHLVLPAAGFKHGTAIEVAAAFNAKIVLIRSSVGPDANDAAFNKCLNGQLTLLGQYTVAPAASSSQ